MKVLENPCKATVSELRDKEVINVSTGARLGFVCDVEFDTQSGQICFLFVPPKLFFLPFKKCENIKIPWNCICQIGRDLILVKL